MKKLCYVATIPAVVHSFLKGHVRAAAKSWTVNIVSHPIGSGLLKDLDVEFIPLKFERKASPWRDLQALIHLTIMFRRERFDLVHSIMPKTGLLSMLAGYLAGVPVRMHTFTGQVWANKRGWRRSALKMFDKLIVLFATHILVDSPSQRDFLVTEGVLKQNQGLVIGYGSICGVDANQFHQDAEMRQIVRAELGIDSGQTVILFLGRLNRDKGILDLAQAFANLAFRRTDVVLVLVGAEEDAPFAQVQSICAQYRERLRMVSFTSQPERYMAMADLFCLPSYREGFGQVIIEAAACGVATVASRIYGISDAVEDEKTGLLFPAGDVELLTQLLLKMVENCELRKSMGEAAYVRVRNLFSSQKITDGLMAIYADLLEKH